MNQPIVFDLDGATLTIRNRYHTLSTDHLRFVAVNEVDGDPVAEASSPYPLIPPGSGRHRRLPADDPVSPASGETWLTVRAELAAATPWADHGHEVAPASSN